MTTPLCLESLSDHTLLSQFGDLVSQDYRGKANLIRHIDAIDQRKLWAKLGHSSLFGFLVARYQMSESTTAKRIGAARTARRFPILFAMIARGEIHLSGIHRLAAHLTAENHESVLAEAKHKTIREIEKLLARLAPQADAPSTVRALPRRNSTSAAQPSGTQTSLAQTSLAQTPLAQTSLAQTPLAQAPLTQAPLTQTPLAHAGTTTAAIHYAATAQASPQATSSASAAVTPQATRLPPRRTPDPVPLSPGRYRLQVTLGEEAHSKLEQLQDLLAHQIPNSDPAIIVERALDALLTEVLKHKTAATKKPRAPKADTTSAPRVSGLWVRSGPAAVRREVWKRDCGRCTFVGADGHRCNETRRLEFAHLEPWAKGGETTIQNIALRCQAHNAWEADRDYGADFMARKRQPKVRTKATELSEPQTPLEPRATLPQQATLQPHATGDPPTGDPQATGDAQTSLATDEPRAPHEPQATRSTLQPQKPPAPPGLLNLREPLARYVRASVGISRRAGPASPPVSPINRPDCTGIAASRTPV